MLLKRCLTIAFMVALAGGCGGLRQLPVTGNDAGPGAGGSAAGAAGRGGAGTVSVARRTVSTRPLMAWTTTRSFWVRRPSGATACQSSP